MSKHAAPLTWHAALWRRRADPANEIPLDYQYTWAQDSYSKRQRTVDTWSFVLLLRARLFLLDKPWSYPGEE